VRDAIHELKYAGAQVLAAPLGQLMADAWRDLAPADRVPDVIVPVPLHPQRERDRGYNQATLLARELGLRLSLGVDERALVRHRNTAPQVGLDAPARRANLADAFGCTGSTLQGRHVLLVDDVFTTGATLEAASKALDKCGAASVWAYTLARAR
jgi:ComF family protein